MRTKKIKRLTVCAMSAALNVVFLYIGAFVEVLDISSALLASLLCAVIVIEYGKSAPWYIYAVTSALSLLLLPQKFPAIIYAVFFGYYPIIKEKIESIRKRVIQWVVKLIVFSAASTLLLLMMKLFTVEIEGALGIWMALVYLVVMLFTLILYDVALTRVISFYIFKLRNRFKNIF